MTMPDHDSLYQALLNRDPRLDGRVVVGVRTTGVFCRLTCPARKPKQANCQFFDSPSAALAAGFRPCRRCHPLASGQKSDPMTERLLEAMNRDPSRRWTETDIKALGLEPSTVRRSFKRQFGMTFLHMARLSRLRDGFISLAAGGRVIDAQLDAGFESASGFRAAFARMLGRPPAAFHGKEQLKAALIDTPLGAMIAIADRKTLHLLEFLDRRALPGELQRLCQAAKGDLGIGRYPPIEQLEAELGAYFSAEQARFSVPLTLHAGGFARNVWQVLRQIPPGETRSYGEIARQLGRPQAARAVARANGANMIALVIPCHRVIGADGALTGYGGGLWRKQQLLELERRLAVRKGDNL